MKYLSLLEKIEVLFEVLLSYKFILSLVIIIIVFTLLYLCKIISNKKYVLSISLSLIISLMISIIGNYKILSNTFDDFMTIFFSGIYFPSIYVYIGVFIIILLAFITSMISSKNKVYKILNSITFIINNIFLIIILNIISENNINVFQISSLYTNNILVVILELNMLLFILWISSLIVVYITEAICDKMTLKKMVTNEVVVKESALVSEIESIKEETIASEIEEVKKEMTDDMKEAIVDEINEEVFVNVIETAKEATLTNVIEDDIVIEKSDVTENKMTFNDILNGLIPVTYYDDDKSTINYNIVNPQEIYENNYNSLKLELESEKKNIKVTETKVIEPEVIITKSKPKVNVSLIKNVESIEDITKKIKNENMKKNLISNTISLNDLIKEDEEIKVVEEVTTATYDDSYTLEDYKKIVAMLKEIKNNSNRSNISIETAVNMSLISNYSIDDCVKFKEILESNLN